MFFIGYCYEPVSKMLMNILSFYNIDAMVYFLGTN